MLSEDSPIVLPDWIGEEVTGDQRYKKANMFAARSESAPLLAAAEAVLD
jgi:CYTH domain-containing protein